MHRHSQLPYIESGFGINLFQLQFIVMLCDTYVQTDAYACAFPTQDIRCHGAWPYKCDARIPHDVFELEIDWIFAALAVCTRQFRSNLLPFAVGAAASRANVCIHPTHHDDDEINECTHVTNHSRIRVQARPKPSNLMSDRSTLHDADDPRLLSILLSAFGEAVFGWQPIAGCESTPYISRTFVRECHMTCTCATRTARRAFRSLQVEYQSQSDVAAAKLMLELRPTANTHTRIAYFCRFVCVLFIYFYFRVFIVKMCFVRAFLR